MSVRTISDLAVLRTYVQELLAELKSREQAGQAAVLALTGDLGAGKTAFTKLLATELAVEAPITSPTFVIMKRYDTADTYFETLVHIDAYRIEAPEEMQVLRFAELCQQPNTLVVVEWAERIETLLPKEAVRLTIDINDDMTRSITKSYEQANY